MLTNNDIVGQKRPLAILSSFIENDTIPHALIFLGPDGVGKKFTAKLFLMLAACCKLTDLQEKTRICKLISEDKHPDMLKLAAEGAFIKAEQVRNLIESLAIRPVEGGLRGIIIEDAAKMNASAANALLKTLEEPYPNTLFILTARSAAEVMPTILSRCQRINFQPLKAAELKELFTRNALESSMDWESLASLSGGSFTRAQELLTPDTIAHRKWLLNELAHLPQSSAARVLSLAFTLNKFKEAYLDYDLDLILSWLRDLVSLKITAASVINSDFLPQLQYNVNLYSLDALNEKLTLLQKITATLKNGTNTNPRLGWEYLLLSLK